MPERPTSIEDAARTLARLAGEGGPVRVVGGRTKLDWGGVAEARVELETSALNRILEHNRGDFTAVLQAGVRLADARAAFAEAGQMLAWDPPAGAAGEATVGGVVATADSGPSRHRYGGVRDVLVGITMILSDGTVARAGGKVIKNVAGYDLGKLFAGSLGTIGMIAAINVRLHPATREAVTVIGASEDQERIAKVAAELARRPLEADCLDIRWEDGLGCVLTRFAGAAAARRASAMARDLALEQVKIVEDDDPLWERQRSLQRSADGAVLKVSARPTDLSLVLSAARDAQATVASRAALGLSWIAFPPGEDLSARVARFSRTLAPRACAPLDGARRAAVAPPALHPGPLALTRRIKRSLDPAGCFPPTAVGEV